MSYITRSLNEADGNTTSFTQQQNRGVLVAGLTCACFSVLATLITLRWFILMKRTFRHKLIMFLIFSDTFKALWYFVFPVVVFSRGSVRSSSKFCQATGFFLAVGIEASDFAILMIALHSLLYIFRPPARSGDSGGLYRWRKALYPCWIIFPVLAAALAFVNQQDAYATAGTFCYLPRRPIWYRLALSWIPRYFVMSLIFAMYTAVYVYVTLKFRSFSNLQEPESNYSSSVHSRRSSMSGDDIAPDESAKPPESPKKPRASRPVFSRSASHNQRALQASTELNPWDEVSFITSKPLKRVSGWQPGTETSDFAMNQDNSNLPSGAVTPHTKDQPFRMTASAPASRKTSHVPTMSSSSHTGESATHVSHPTPSSRQISQAVQKLSQTHPQPKAKDPLKRTRKAIRKQLRYLFIYPAVYVFMWIFPFVSHCLLYDDYYVQHPIYWLTVVSTCMFSLQAGVDCVVFSWREKPWRRIPAGRKFSLQSFRASFSLRRNPHGSRSAATSIAIGPDEEDNTEGTHQNGFASGPSSRAPSNHWWEAEGRARKDSVWMGTDAANGPELQRRDTLAHISEAGSFIAEREEYSATENARELERVLQPEMNIHDART